MKHFFFTHIRRREKWHGFTSHACNHLAPPPFFARTLIPSRARPRTESSLYFRTVAAIRAHDSTRKERDPDRSFHYFKASVKFVYFWNADRRILRLKNYERVGRERKSSCEFYEHKLAIIMVFREWFHSQWAPKEREEEEGRSQASRTASQLYVVPDWISRRHFISSFIAKESRIVYKRG